MGSEEKRLTNARKHGVDFADVVEVFDGIFALEDLIDIVHNDENRHACIWRLWSCHCGSVHYGR